MTELVVPYSPHWFKYSMLICAPDNTLIFGAKQRVYVVEETGRGQPPKITILDDIHGKYVSSVAINKQWGGPNKFCVSVAGENRSIILWDIAQYQMKLKFPGEIDGGSNQLSAVFAGDDRVLIVSQDGLITIWNIVYNEVSVISHLFPPKTEISCVASCPHASWVVAFGLHNGLVIVTDLRRNGKILYKLRGHDKSICSLAWCPAPVNVFPKSPQNTVKNRSKNGEITRKKTGSAQKSEGNKEINGAADNAGTCTVEGESSEKEDSTETGAAKKSEGNKEINAAVDNVGTCTVEEEPSKNEDSIETGAAQKSEGTKEIIGTTDNAGSCTVEEESTETGAAHDDTDNAGNCNVEEEKGEKEESESCSNDGNMEEKCDSPENVNKSDYDDDKVDNYDDDTNNSVANKIESCKTDDELTVEENIAIDKEDTYAVIENSIAADNTEPCEIIGKTGDVGKEAACQIEEKETDNTCDDAQVSVEKMENDRVIPEVVEEEPRDEYLLASVGKDRKIYIWRADGRFQTYFIIPDKKKKFNKSQIEWFVITWITPTCILSNSVYNELLSWHLPKTPNRSYSIIHKFHENSIMYITHPPIYYTKYNWRDTLPTQCWTFDRKGGNLVNYDFELNEVKTSIPTVVQEFYIFGQSPVDPNRILIGTKSGNIVKWDFTSTNTPSWKIRNACKPLNSKITALAWHPTMETVFAYGTDEGQIGLALNADKVRTFPIHSRNTIHKMEWGPVNGNKEEIGLYACTEGTLLIYTFEGSGPILFEPPDSLSVYNFAWKPDYSMLVISMKDGSVLFLSTDLVTLAIVYLNEKCLNCLTWHSECCDPTSPYFNWFAAGTSKGFLVYNVEAVTNESDENLAEKKVLDVDGHLKPVSLLAWNPFESHKIATSSSDGSILVWDVNAKVVISTYITNYNFFAPILWSPSEPNQLITCHHSLMIYDITKYPPQSDDDFSTRKKLMSKSSRKENTPVIKIQIKKNNGAINKTKSARNCIVPALYSSSEEKADIQITHMKKLINNEYDANQVDPFKLFGSQTDVLELLNNNFQQHQRASKYQFCDLISLWTGDIATAVKSAIESNRVTPQIIACAPLVSPQLRSLACEVYAKKLAEDVDSDPFETATYFLLAHKIEEAVDVLCQNALYREALALAKCRLPDDKAMIEKITENWAKYANTNGNYELASYCYSSLKNYKETAKLLLKRNNVDCLEFAAELAGKCENKELLEAINFKINELASGKDKAEGGDDQTEITKELPTRAELLLKSIGALKSPE